MGCWITTLQTFEFLTGGDKWCIEVWVILSLGMGAMEEKKFLWARTIMPLI